MCVSLSSCARGWITPCINNQRMLTNQLCAPRRPDKPQRHVGGGLERVGVPRRRVCSDGHLLDGPRAHLPLPGTAKVRTDSLHEMRLKTATVDGSKKMCHGRRFVDKRWNCVLLMVALLSLADIVLLRMVLGFTLYVRLPVMLDAGQRTCHERRSLCAHPDSVHARTGVRCACYVLCSSSHTSAPSGSSSPPSSRPYRSSSTFS